MRHFLRTGTFLVARLLALQARGMDWKQGVTRFPGLVLAPVLAPYVQVSLHTAQSKRFPKLATSGVGVGSPGSHYATQADD